MDYPIGQEFVPNSYLGADQEYLKRLGIHVSVHIQDARLEWKECPGCPLGRSRCFEPVAGFPRLNEARREAGSGRNGIRRGRSHPQFDGTRRTATDEGCSQGGASKPRQRIFSIRTLLRRQRTGSCQAPGPSSNAHSRIDIRVYRESALRRQTSMIFRHQPSPTRQSGPQQRIARPYHPDQPGSRQRASRRSAGLINLACSRSMLIDFL